MAPSRSSSLVLSLVVALSVALSPATSHAQLNVSPPELAGVGVDEHFN